MSDSNVVPLTPPLLDHVDYLSKEASSLSDYLKLLITPPYSIDRVLSLLPRAVIYMQRFHDLDGVSKKQIVLHVIRNLINSSNMSDSEKHDAIEAIDTVGNTLVDHLVSFGTDAMDYAKTKMNCCKKSSKSIKGAKAMRSLRENDKEGSLYVFIKNSLQPPYTRERIISIIAKTVSISSHFDKMSYAERQALVLSTLKDVVSNEIHDEEIKSSLLLAVDLYGSCTIEMFTDFAEDAVDYFKSSCCNKGKSKRSVRL